MRCCRYVALAEEIATSQHFQFDQDLFVINVIMHPQHTIGRFGITPSHCQMCHSQKKWTRPFIIHLNAYCMFNAVTASEQSSMPAATADIIVLQFQPPRVDLLSQSPNLSPEMYIQYRLYD